MHPILFQFPDFIPVLGGKAIHFYGVMIALGFVFGHFWTTRESRQKGLDVGKMQDLLFYIVIAGLFGSRVFYVFQSVPDFFSDPMVFFRVWEGGLVFQGGIVGAAVLMIFLTKRFGVPFFEATDVFAPALSVGHGLGRLGCLFAGCCHGATCPTDFPFALIFPHVAHGVAPVGVPLYPTQPLETLGEALIFLCLFYFRKHKPFSGAVFVLYLILYSILRFFVEFWRGDLERGFVFEGVLSNGQLWSLIGVLIAVVMGVVLAKKQKSNISGV